MQPGTGKSRAGDLTQKEKAILISSGLGQTYGGTDGHLSSHGLYHMGAQEDVRHIVAHGREASTILEPVRLTFLGASEDAKNKIVGLYDLTIIKLWLS
jgi:hypothetical protein